MLVACFIILTSIGSQPTQNAIDVTKVAAVEQLNGFSKIYMDREGLSLNTAEKMETILTKIKEAKAACRLTDG